MENLDEIKEKLVQQLKENHQKTISEDSLVGKLANKYGDLDLNEIEDIKKYLTHHGITVTDSVPDMSIDDKEFEDIISQINVNDPVKMYSQPA